MNLELIICFLAGGLVGAIGWSIVIARDESVARLEEDEVIVKRPAEGNIFMQVPPTIARKIINTWGGSETDPKISPAPGEARSLYSDRYLRARQTAEAAEQKMPNQKI